MTESWDEDPDLDLPEGAFTLAGSTTSTNTAEGAAVTSASASGQSASSTTMAGFPSEGEGGGPGLEKWMDESTEDWDDVQRNPFERTSASDLDATAERTQEDEDQSSTSSSRSSTLKGLHSSFSGLSLDQTSPTREGLPRSDSSSTMSTSSHSSSVVSATVILPTTPRPSSSRRATSPDRTPVAFSTLRHGSQLSNLIASANAGPGRVHHLGSTPQGAAKSVLGDWDEDLDFGSLDDRGLPLERAKELRAKSSFSSHISDDPEGDAFLDGASRGLPTPRSSKKAGDKPSATAREGRLSTSDFTHNEEDGFEVESDFELPDDVSRIALSSLLARASNSSLSAHSRSSSAALPPPVPVALPLPTLSTRAPSRHSTASPGLSFGATTTDDEEEDDEAFFEEIVLPPYFLGGPGAMTPPSDGEGRFGGRIDLQAMLKNKLEARGGKTGEPAGASSGKLDGYREGENEDAGGEEGLVIEVGVKLGEERMRTRSGPKPPALLKSRRSASASSTLPASSSRSRAPPLPRSSSAFALTSISSTRPGSTLSRSGSATSLSTLSSTANIRSAHSSVSTDPSPGPSPNRPSSAAGQIDRAARPERRGPPPAPSTAARDRVRTRTVSLKTATSNTDLRGSANSMQTPQQATRRPPRLEMGRPGAGGAATILSPVPMTPATPSSATSRPTLRSKRSQGNLLVTPSTRPAESRTIERKRSLQTLPRLELHAGTPISTSTSTATSKRPLRSPTPSTPSASPANLSSFFSPAPSAKQRSTPSAASFAAPTAASISRVRERVASNPVLPPSPLMGASPLLPHLSQFPPRPSSAASGRLLQPTASSAAKASAPHPASRPSTALNTSPIAGLRIPAQSLKLSRPKKERAYGDGTELDAFDDLPLTKSERERERTVSMGMKRTGSGSTIKGGFRGTVKASEADQARARRAANRSGGSSSTTSSNAREGGSTIKASRSSKPTTPGGPLKKVGSIAQLALPPASTKRAKAESAEEGVEKKQKAGERRKRKEPHLIRNLGAPGVAKVHGEMTWNPTLQRWGGNESVLRDFDKALASSTRPALITQLSSNLSPNRVNFPSLKPSTDTPTDLVKNPSLSSQSTSLLGAGLSSGDVLRHGSTSSTLSAPNVKVVGSMVFDPVRMSWHSLAPDGEDELDLMFEGSDWADDEGDGRAPSSMGGAMDDEEDGWAQGEKERMLKNQASFVMSDGGDAEESETRRALRASCAEGEARHREEMRWWTKREEEGDEEEMRESLYDIRALIMESRTPPR